MFLLRLLLRNAFRHKLRTGLAMLGLTVAICAFGLLRTILDAWYAGVNASSSTRLVTRSAISLTFPLPLNYAQRMRGVAGVERVAGANWFGGIYITERNFFPNFAIDAPNFLALYPEYVLPEAEKRAFLRDRQGAVVGRKLALKYGWKLGDTIPLRGTIFAGTWSFTLRGIWDGIDERTDETQMLMHWDYVNETLRQRRSGMADFVGFYVIGIREPGEAALISQQVDALFRNSRAETLTETEKAFQLGFVSMSETLLLAIEAVSGIVILIIMAVMANAMAMTARERLSEYATLKALGFGPGFIARLLCGEALLIALLGGALGVAASHPLAAVFRQAAGTLFPVFHISTETMVLQLGAAALVGAVAATWPAWKMSRLSVVDGLRHVA